MPDMEEMFEKFQSMFCDDKAERLPVAKLSGDLRLAWKRYQSESRKMVTDVRLLEKKAKAMLAIQDLRKQEFWNKVYKAHGLPSDCKYEIESDGVINKVVQPEK